MNFQVRRHLLDPFDISGDSLRFFGDSSESFQLRLLPLLQSFSLETPRGRKNANWHRVFGYIRRYFQPPKTFDSNQNIQTPIAEYSPAELLQQSYCFIG